MKTGVINCKAFFNAGMRIDPDMHLSEGSIIRNELNHLPYQLSTVGENAADVFYGNIFSRIFVQDPEHGMPYLAASDTVLANLDTGRFLSKKQAAQLNYLILKKDWILVTCSGTLGNVTYTNKTFENHIATHDLIRIIPNSNKVNKGTLYAFLASKFGYYQITQSQFGGVVKHINTDQTKSIIVPVFPADFQQEVDDMIQESARLREEATDALNEAVSIFEKEIGTSYVNFGYNYKSIHSSAILGNFLRLDSQYQIGKSQISKYHNTVKIGDIAKRIFIGNRGKRYYVNKGTPFLSSSDMMLANPLLTPKQISVKTPNIADMIVSNRDILISRSGTVGNTIIVGEKLSGVAVSEHAMRLVVDAAQIAPEYVFAYLMTKHGHDALQVLPYGSVIVTLGEEFLRDVDLPIVPKDKMTQIVNLVTSYILKIDASMGFESAAIAKVEQEIEKWNN